MKPEHISSKSVADGEKPTYGQAFQEAFFALQPSVRSLFSLFDHLPNIFFHAKDVEHRYIGANNQVLKHVFNGKKLEDLLGHTDSEFQPPTLADAYHAEDKRVMEFGETIASQIWLVPQINGMPRWYASTKSPLFDPSGNVIGTVGAMYPVSTPKEKLAYFRELLPVINYIEEHYTDPISMGKMAEMAKLSMTRFNARFQEILKMPPTEYQLRLRIQAAQKLLVTSEKAISEIATECGFSDQSHLGKRFKKVTGITPREYRAQFR
ncbi:helix-turn-helix domain-containing protein [Luteolibacter algae]|uniref:Helix-turn-helix domain-containing protein n=1 Tax=Luteolibacter algae TaxID=454151 RepID=A0ABW5DAR6_9BACT